VGGREGRRILEGITWFSEERKWGSGVIDRHKEGGGGGGGQKKKMEFLVAGGSP